MNFDRVRIATSLLMLQVSLVMTSQHDGVIEMSGSYGRFSSDDFPTRETYPNDVNTSWQITVAEGFHVRLFFTTFDVEDSYDKDQGGACVYDYVQVDDGDRLCGEHHPWYVRSLTSTMTVRFVTDYSNEEPLPRGFEAHFVEEDDDECKQLSYDEAHGDDWDTFINCNHHCHNTPGSYYCTCRVGFTLHDNQHTCLENCPSEALTAPNGTLQSADFPAAYSKLSDCERIIQLPLGREIKIRFDPVFEIEDHFEEGCVYDWLKVWGKDEGDAHMWCGDSAPNNGSWIKFNSNVVKILFHTDLAVEKRGYQMFYESEAVVCSDVIEAPTHGRIVTSQDKFEYDDVIEFDCERGYRLIGSRESRCNINGQWSEDPPICQIKSCEYPAHLTNISRTVVVNGTANISLTYGSTFTLECMNKWYWMTSGVASWMCDDDEQWHEASLPISPNDNNNFPICMPECGVKNKKDARKTRLGGHIMGGRNATYGEWPWVAMIQFSEKYDDICGGALVYERYVVTAAHCTARIADATDITVILGMTYRNNLTHAQTFTVIEKHEHDGYQTRSFMHDIAVLKLDRSATIGQYVRPICLPYTEKQKHLPQWGYNKTENFDWKGIVIGWGKTGDVRLPANLMEVKVPYVPTADCRNSLKEDERWLISDSHMFCAGSMDKVKDSCQGDSGGPIMFRDRKGGKDGRFYLSGVVSFGTSGNCSALTTLGVYTDVGSYVDEFLANYIILYSP